MTDGGIIPAGAGLTSPCRILACRGRDHPRGCGAHFIVAEDVVGGEGSSPRVRGSLEATQATIAPQGIIPAGAGLTGLSTARSNQSRDHPRGCGAHIDTRRELEKKGGSSPRVRGSLVLGCLGRHPPGIIPAGAGLTCTSSTSRTAARDHPRGCGAHSRTSSQSIGPLGSSPRVRGSHAGYLWSDWRTGIIPAGAGLTLFVVAWTSITRDHPRGCGAHYMPKKKLA